MNADFIFTVDYKTYASLRSFLYRAADLKLPTWTQSRLTLQKKKELVDET